MAVMAVLMVMLSNATTHYLTYRPIQFKYVDAVLPIYIIAISIATNPFKMLTYKNGQNVIRFIS